MSKRSTKRKQVIAKRKKQFLALVFSMAFALIPTVSVMAESITIKDDNDLESYIGKNIYPGEELTWIYSSGATFSPGGFYAVFYRYPSGEGRWWYSTGAKNRAADQDQAFTSSVQNGVEDLDHWQVYSCGRDPRTEYKQILIELKAVYTTDAATVKVSADPAGGGNPKSGKEKVFNGDKNISLEAGKNEGYVFEKWSVDSSHITIADPSSENTTFEAGDVAAGETINIKAEYTKIYEVTFDPNGGEVTESRSRQVSRESLPDSLKIRYGKIMNSQDGTMPKRAVTRSIQAGSFCLIKHCMPIGRIIRL